MFSVTLLSVITGSEDSVLVSDSSVDTDVSVIACELFVSIVSAKTVKGKLFEKIKASITADVIALFFILTPLSKQCILSHLL